MRFDSPSEGASVNVPFAASISAVGPDGSSVDFDSAKITLDGKTFDGKVTNASAAFTGLTAGAGPKTMVASITRGSCSAEATDPNNKIPTASRTVTVIAACTPAFTSVTFPQDLNSDGTLNSTELPSASALQVRVVATCVDGTQAQVKRGGTVVGPATAFTSGTAVVAVPVTADGTFDLVAELVKAGAVAATRSASIKVVRAPPSCLNTTQLLNGPNDDADSTKAAFQLSTTGTVGANVTRAEFRITGQTTQMATPMNNMVGAQFTFPLTGDNTVSVDLVCTDDLGNTATDSKMVRMDFAPPVVVITAPAMTDAGPALVTVSPVQLVISTMGAEDGSDACVFKVVGMTRTPAGCGTVVGGAASLPVSFSADGTYTYEVVVTDASGNKGSASTTLLVQLSGCGLGFARPAACPALVTNAQVSNGSYTFQTQSKATCAGQPVALSVKSQLADGGMGTSMTVGMANINAGGVASVSATVSSGTFFYSAVVTNVGVDAGVSSAECEVTVDLDGPAIQSPLVPTGQPYATINSGQDTQSGVAGAQRLLQFSARIPTGGRVDVCTTQATDPVSGQARMATVACGTGYYLLQGTVTSPASAFTFPEGTYSIKVVVVATDGTTIESAPVALLVDVTRPCVRAASKRLPQDANADARLNAGELGTAAPQLEFDLDPACKDSSLATLSSVAIREIVGSAAPSGSFALATDVTFAASKFTVNLTQGVAAEKDYVFWIELTDVAGNRNIVQVTADPSNFPVRVDRTAPSCSIVTPAASTTLLGKAQVPSSQFGVTVATAADVVANGVSVTLAGPGAPQTQMLTPSGAGNQASAAFAVSGTNAYTVTSTCRDVAGNQTSATARTLTIDLDDPTCTITSPTSVSAYATNQINTSLTLSGADGRQVSCSTTVGAGSPTPLSPSLPLVASNATSISQTYPNGTQTVACSVTDLAGNAGSCSVANVVVNSTSCGLTISNAVNNPSGTWFNRSNTSGITGSTGTATVTANTADCGVGRTVTLQRTLPSAGAPVTQATAANGDATFAGVTLTDGETWSVTIDNGAGVTTTQTFRVALVAPSATSVTINSVAVANGANLYFVAPTGNRNVETAVAGYFADLSAGSAGAQFDLAVNAIVGARKFGLDGTLRVLFNGATIVSQAISADPQTVSLAGNTLQHNVSSTFVVRLIDAAGNQSDIISNATQVDVIAPASPAVTQAVTNARQAQVSLQWNPTYDDSSDSASGANAGYDLRWTTSSVPGNGSLGTSTLYFGATSATEPLVSWSGSPISRAVTLPPLNTYFIAVRARDEMGNYSDFVVPTPLPNLWTQVTITNPSTATDFGSTIASGNVTGDALQDLAVAAVTRGNIGSVYLYTGSNPFNSFVGCGSGCLELTPPDGQGTQYGSDVSIAGNVSDDATDVSTTGMADILVGQRGFSGTVGRAFLYLGSTAGPTKRVEFRSDATNSTIGIATRVLSDIDGDGRDEVALTAHLFGGGRGRVYVFKGRDFADWQAKFVAGQTYILVTSADWVIEGDFPLIPATPVNTSNGFGLNRLGLTSLPGATAELRADGGVIPEVAVPMSRGNVSRVVLFRGGTIMASSPLAPALTASAVQTLSQTPVANSSLALGFGQAAWGKRRVFGAGPADLFVSYPNQATVYYYSNWGLGGAPAGNATGSIAGPALFGSFLSVGDLNSDGLEDLAVSEGALTANGAWVLYQKTSMGPFDSPVGSSNIRFQVSEFRMVTGTVASKFGLNGAVVDLDGLNGPDLIFADETTGVVRVWR